MANYNRVILAGNLTRDPELSYTPSNTPICKFGMAINRRWRGQDGNSREETCFVDCTAFGRQAETINQYMNKGRPLLIEGRLNYSQWTGQDGQKRSKLAVVVETFQFLGGRQDGGGGGGPVPARSAPRSTPSAAPMDSEPPPPEPDDYGSPPGGEDPIPF